MKTLLLTLASTILCMNAFTSTSFATELPKEVDLGINEVFIPAGFDHEADAYVVVSGIFPNGCYRWKGSTVNDISGFVHEIKSKALVSQGMCLMVLVPFTKEVRLGKLQSGTHTLRFISGDGTFLEKSLQVE